MYYVQERKKEKGKDGFCVKEKKEWHFAKFSQESKRVKPTHEGGK